VGLLLKSISRLQFAAIELSAIGSNLVGAGGPRNPQIRTQRENNLEPVDLRFNAGSLASGRQSECHIAAKNRGVRLADGVAQHGTNHLGFYEKGHTIGPGQNRCADRAAATGKPVGLYFCERARPCNTGDPRILKLLAFAGVER